MPAGVVAGNGGYEDLCGGDGCLEVDVMEVGEGDLNLSPTCNSKSCPQHVCGNASTREFCSSSPSLAKLGPSREPSLAKVASGPRVASGSSMEGVAGASTLGGLPPRGSAPPPLSSQGTPPNPWTVRHCRELVFSDARSDFVAEDGVTVQVDLGDVAVCEMRLEAALVGRVFGRPWSFTPLCRELKKAWSKFGQFQVNMIGPNCFICFFGSKETRDLILRGGPWFVAGQLIGVNKWSASFDPSSAAGLSSPIWVRFPGLPLNYWGDRNLGRIASMVGTPLWVDGITSSYGRTEFARVCVRLDFSSSLPTGVWIQGKDGRFFQAVEYEGIDHLCFRCGVVGHFMEECKAGVGGRGGASSQATPSQVSRDGSSGGGSARGAVGGGRPEGIAGVGVGAAGGPAGASESRGARHSGGVETSGGALPDQEGWRTVVARRRQRPPARSQGRGGGAGVRQAGGVAQGQRVEPPRPVRRSIPEPVARADILRSEGQARDSVVAGAQGLSQGPSSGRHCRGDHPAEEEVAVVGPETQSEAAGDLGSAQGLSGGCVSGEVPPVGEGDAVAEPGPQPVEIGATGGVKRGAEAPLGPECELEEGVDPLMALVPFLAVAVEDSSARKRRKGSSGPSSCGGDASPRSQC